MSVSAPRPRWDHYNKSLAYTEIHRGRDILVSEGEGFQNGRSRGEVKALRHDFHNSCINNNVSFMTEIIRAKQPSRLCLWRPGGGESGSKGPTSINPRKTLIAELGVTTRDFSSRIPTELAGPDIISILNRSCPTYLNYSQYVNPWKLLLVPRNLTPGVSA